MLDGLWDIGVRGRMFCVVKNLYQGNRSRVVVMGNRKRLMLTGLKELDLMLEVSICRVGSKHHRSMALSVLDCLHQGQCAAVRLLATRFLEGSA